MRVCLVVAVGFLVRQNDQIQSLTQENQRLVQVNQQLTQENSQLHQTIQTQNNQIQSLTQENNKLKTATKTATDGLNNLLSKDVLDAVYTGSTIALVTKLRNILSVLEPLLPLI